MDYFIEVLAGMWKLISLILILGLIFSTIISPGIVLLYAANVFGAGIVLNIKTVLAASFFYHMFTWNPAYECLKFLFEKVDK